MAATITDEDAPRQTDLFGQEDDAPVEGYTGPVAVVAIDQSVDKTLDYAIGPAHRAILKVGQQVKVPLGRGNKPATGYVVGISDRSRHASLKRISAITDERPLVTGKLLELALWLARYYCTPLGMVIDNIVPSAVKKRIGLGYVTLVSLAVSHDELKAVLDKTRGAKRRALLAQLLQMTPDDAVPIGTLAGEAGVKPPTVRKLAAAGLIRITEKPDVAGLGEASSLALTPPSFEPNAEQRHVIDDIAPRLDAGFGVHLIRGVTGSGKTEVYLQLIRRVVDAGKQAIVLVPEIALTPQTVRRFTDRFERVAVLHSGLNASRRHRYWQQVSSGSAQVVVGARSAVFAPTPNLGIIVVDEEHEASYKQDQQPRYHARDVAIKRAQLGDVPVILGSATPSLETWARVQPRPSASGEQPKAFLHTLHRRAADQPMPKVEIVDLRDARRERKGIHLFSQRLEKLITETLAKKEQAILLLNRRGYSNFVLCSSCNEPLKCDYCDTTMTYHRFAGEAGDARADHATASGQLQCHYCLAVRTLPQTCPVCGKRLTLFGLGTQRVEEELKRKFPNIRYARVDSDSMHTSRDYEETLAAFGRGELDLLLGTQMIAKGLDFPNVTLVGVVSADTALALPDFRASERTFQLITQVAGRAGRGDRPGRVVVQSFQPDQPAIVTALAADYPTFAERELRERKEVGLPPFSRMVRIVLREEDEAKLQTRAETLAGSVASAISALPHPDVIKLQGPMPCAINRIAGFWRQQIVMTAASPVPLQMVLGRLREKSLLSAGERIAVDVDPVSLL